MAAVTLTEAQSYLDTWVAAQNALAGANSYSFSMPNGHSRTVTRASLQEIQSAITYWHRVINALSASAAGVSSPTVRTPRWT